MNLKDRGYYSYLKLMKKLKENKIGGLGNPFNWKEFIKKQKEESEAVLYEEEMLIKKTERAIQNHLISNKASLEAYSDDTWSQRIRSNIEKIIEQHMNSTVVDFYTRKAILEGDYDEHANTVAKSYKIGNGPYRNYSYVPDNQYGLDTFDLIVLFILMDAVMEGNLNADFVADTEFSQVDQVASDYVDSAASESTSSEFSPVDTKEKTDSYDTTSSPDDSSSTSSDYGFSDFGSSSSYDSGDFDCGGGFDD